MKVGVEKEICSNQFAASAPRVVGARTDWCLAKNPIRRCAPFPTLAANAV